MNPFLQAIIANPAEDVHRLVYADWLDENGDPARAEVIRVQVELEPLRQHGHGTERLHGGDCPACSRIARLEYRERKLLSDHIGKWRIVVEVCPEVGSFVVCPAVVFRRGFVAEVSCTMADWLAHGQQIVSENPIEKVTITDKKPRHWQTTNKGRRDHWSWTVNRPQNGLVFRSEADAIDALSHDCLLWAKAGIACPSPTSPSHVDPSSTPICRNGGCEPSAYSPP